MPYEANPFIWIIGSSILMCILSLAGALTFSLSDKLCISSSCPLLPYQPVPCWEALFFI